MYGPFDITLTLSVWPMNVARCDVLINQKLLAWTMHSLSLSRQNASQIFDVALHPADISLEWAECDGILWCFAVAALLQPVITCEGEMKILFC